MIFSLKLQGLFGDKGKSTKQVSLKTIINTRIHVILEILLDSFRMGKKILKEWKGVHIEVKGSSSSSLKKKKNTIKQGKIKRENS